MKNENAENGPYKIREMSYLLLLKVNDFYANELLMYLPANIPCECAHAHTHTQLSSIRNCASNFFFSASFPEHTTVFGPFSCQAPCKIDK